MMKIEVMSFVSVCWKTPNTHTHTEKASHTHTRTHTQHTHTHTKRHTGTHTQHTHTTHTHTQWPNQHHFSTKSATKICSPRRVLPFLTFLLVQSEQTLRLEISTRPWVNTAAQILSLCRIKTSIAFSIGCAPIIALFSVRSCNQ